MGLYNTGMVFVFGFRVESSGFRVEGPNKQHRQLETYTFSIRKRHQTLSLRDPEPSKNATFARTAIATSPLPHNAAA